MKYSIPFPTKYLCKSGFFSSIAIETKSRNHEKRYAYCVFRYGSRFRYNTIKTTTLSTLTHWTLNNLRTKKFNCTYPKRDYSQRCINQVLLLQLKNRKLCWKKTRGYTLYLKRVHDYPEKIKNLWYDASVDFYRNYSSTKPVDKRGLISSRSYNNSNGLSSNKFFFER